MVAAMLRGGPAMGKCVAARGASCYRRGMIVPRRSLPLGTVATTALVATALLATALVAPPLAAQRVDTLAPGVVHRTVVRPEGPWVLHVLEVDLRRADLSIDAAHATGTLLGRRRPSDVSRALNARWCRSGRRVLAAVNGDLFELATGENEGNQVVDGVVWKAGRTTDSPFDAIDVAHVQFAMTARGRPLIEQFAFDGVLTAGARAWTLDGVNTRRGGAAVLYTGAGLRRTPVDTAGAARGARREAPFTIVARRGDTVRLQRAGPVRAGGGTPIPTNGAVLSIADSSAAAELLLAFDGTAARGMAPNATLDAVLRFTPDRGALRTLVGGWGRVLDGGVVVAARADTLESLLARFAHGRHGRTSVGFSRDSATLYLVTVDGRRAASVGMTLHELGEAMRSLGAWDAMNLDGGGSAAMAIGGRVVNVPSDSAGERTVGNVLLVVRRGAASCPDR